MKRVTFLLPYVFAVLIIFAGYYSIGIIRNFISPHKESVKIFEKPDRTGLFYMGQSDELIIYPWDIFDEGRCLSGTEYLGPLGYDYIALCSTIRANLSIFGDEALMADRIAEFTPDILYDETFKIFFIKEYEYMNRLGEKCIMSFAFTDMNNCYIHVRGIEENKELTPDELQEAKIKINSYINDFLLYQKEIPQENIFANQLSRFTENFGLFARLPAIIHQDGELLLIYYIETAQVMMSQVILYYNPRLDLITGYSIK